ncbi:MAG: AI-2E family transporter [Acidimicrobiia bacterium]|nr:AI-2E family transporter [Acidimicrobiia bacterium]
MPQEPPDPARVRVVVSPMSIALVLGTLALAVFVRNVADAARSTFALFLVVGILAALATLPIEALARSMSRPLAIVVVLLGALGLLGLVGWGVVGDVRHELDRLEDDAPQAAAQIARSERFGRLAQEVRLEERVDDAVRTLRSTAESQAEDAARRGGRVLVGTVLFVFLLSWGPRLARAGLAQIPDEGRRRRVHHVLTRAVRRGRAYLLLTYAEAVAVGMVVYLAARLADVPGPAPLALAAGAGSIIPLVGTVLGSAPLLLVAAGFTSGWRAGLLAGTVLGLQLIDDALVRPRVNAGVLQVGTAATVTGLLIGLALGGVVGALATVAVVVFLVAAAEAAGVDDPTEAPGADAVGLP